jgi:hypothetical protein
LDGCEADSAGGGVDEDPVSRLDVGAVDEPAVGGGCGDEEAGCVFEAPALWDGEEGGFGSEDVCGVCALEGAEDAITDFEFWGSGSCRCREDCACEFGACDPWEWGLVLVFALDLEQVEEVRAGGVDLDEVFVW